MREWAYQVTLSDGQVPRLQKVGSRDFERILETTWENKASYAEAHNYRYLNASEVLDRGRPPSWSKILAIRKHLPGFDWMLWIDADTLVMNRSVVLESILPVADSRSPDVVFTVDAAGVNAGIWFIRNSPWSQMFLNSWWSMSGYIRGPGDTKSGDNDALKVLLRNMDRQEYRNHVWIAPQCAFNSYLWSGSIRNWARYAGYTERIRTGLYQNGDFILHFAGVNDKQKKILATLKDIKGEHS